MSEKEVLVVNSKIKGYVKAKGLSTSASVAEKLSDKVRDLINQAIERAKLDKRKTLMDRDF
jgi:histone H3/H4